MKLKELTSAKENNSLVFSFLDQVPDFYSHNIDYLMPVSSQITKSRTIKSKIQTASPCAGRTFAGA